MIFKRCLCSTHWPKKKQVLLYWTFDFEGTVCFKQILLVFCTFCLAENIIKASHCAFFFFFLGKCTGFPTVELLLVKSYILGDLGCVCVRTCQDNDEVVAMCDYTTVSYTIIAGCFLSSFGLCHMTIAAQFRITENPYLLILTYMKTWKSTWQELLWGMWFPPHKLGMGWGEHKTHIHSTVLLRRD